MSGLGAAYGLNFTPDSSLCNYLHSSSGSYLLIVCCWPKSKGDIVISTWCTGKTQVCTHYSSQETKEDVGTSPYALAACLLSEANPLSR